MKKMLCAILTIGILLSLGACGQKVTAGTTWQEQYDLGVRYLSEGDYEQAILAFEAAIEIDPKKVDTYAKLAEIHLAMGNTDRAAEVLERGVAETENIGLKQTLDELSLNTGGEFENVEVEVTSEDGMITIQAVGNTLTLSLEDPELQSSYLVNRPQTEDNGCECMWMVRFTDGTNIYEVGTSHWKFEGATPVEKTPYEMQSDVWINNEQGGFTSIAEAELTIQGITMTWSFSVPEKYKFDSNSMEILGTRIVLFDKQETTIKDPS